MGLRGEIEVEPRRINADIAKVAVGKGALRAEVRSQVKSGSLLWGPGG